MSTGQSWESKQAHHVIHQPISMALQCGAGAQLKGLASWDQRRLRGSGSALEECYMQCKSTYVVYFTLLMKLGTLSSR